jgi:hypothetical protein
VPTLTAERAEAPNVAEQFLLGEDSRRFRGQLDHQLVLALRQRDRLAAVRPTSASWVWEPLLTNDDPVARAEEADSLSMAYLLRLERLSPVEHELFRWTDDHRRAAVASEFTIVAVHDGMVRSRPPTGSAGSLIGASRSPRLTFAA